MVWINFWHYNHHQHHSFAPQITWDLLLFLFPCGECPFICLTPRLLANRVGVSGFLSAERRRRRLLRRLLSWCAVFCCLVKINAIIARSVQLTRKVIGVRCIPFDKNGSVLQRHERRWFNIHFLFASNNFLYTNGSKKESLRPILRWLGGNNH